MKTKILFNQKLPRFSLFRFFLWLFAGSFGIIHLFSQTCSAEESLYTAKGKRDPFVQLVTTSARQAAGGLLSVESIEEITVEGIVYAGHKDSIVVANGSVMKEGDEVGNVKVLQIKPEGAVFSVNGVDGYKPLYQEEVKK
jgi:hypothetical protein